MILAGDPSLQVARCLVLNPANPTDLAAGLVSSAVLEEGGWWTLLDRNQRALDCTVVVAPHTPREVRVTCS